MADETPRDGGRDHRRHHLTIIPLHQEMCLNLHDELVGVRNGTVEVI